MPEAAVIDTLIRVAQLVTDHAEIASVDLNPIIVSKDGFWVTTPSSPSVRRARDPDRCAGWSDVEVTEFAPPT